MRVATSCTFFVVGAFEGGWPPTGGLACLSKAKGLTTMNLTDKELEIMGVLWRSDSPMTAADIVVASPDRTWQDTSIHIILKTLERKGVVAVDHLVPTSGRWAKAYKAVFTAAQCALKQAQSYGVCFLDMLSAICECEKTAKLLSEQGWEIKKTR